MKRTVALSVFVVLLVSLLLAVSSAQSQQDTRQQPLVFTHVTLIDMTGAPAKPDMIVLITGERITALGKVDEIPIPRGAQVVAAIGKFLIPGLWDMHVHTLGKEKVETFFPLFIANGVTGVRDMGTTPDGFSGLKQWRKQIAEGTRLGPRIVAAGSIVDGAKPQLRAISIAVNNEAEARQTVRYLKQRGADFIKVYSRLSRRAYYAVADEAKKQRMPFAGHVPFSVTAAEASDAGQSSIEHMFGVLEGCSPLETALTHEAMQARTMHGALRSQVKSIDTYDDRRAAALFQRLAKNHTWQVPTLTSRRSAAFRDDSNFSNDPRLRYVLPRIRETWGPKQANRSRPSRYLTADDFPKLQRLFRAQLKILDIMRRTGVEFLAGTDTPIAYVFPGFSLHDELALLVEAGFTPMEALQSATRNSATFLGMLNSLGTVEKGKIADLVLLEANPLENISNTQRIAAVVVNGRLLNRMQLDRMLARVEASAKR